MQVKTFVYGTPLGFNFYEDDSQYKDYFKDFYISSREGRRLMVNRLDNGETSYNFLCYRLIESQNRPNAFFGMSLVLGDYVYCGDFGKLYNWFNFLFDKLINERNLFVITDNGLRYTVPKFSEDVQDVEWLKSNIPNILSSSGTQLVKYDTSFSNKKTGKIVLVNPEDKPENILNVFRQNRWICITPSVVSDNDCPELDYGELSSFLDAKSKELLPIGINPEEKHIPVLKKIFEEAKENSLNISEYLEKSKDDENKKRFSELGKMYNDLLTQHLPKIVEKLKGIESPPPPPPSHSETKVCNQCGQQKPINAFAIGDNVCRECRNKQSKKRICKKCKKEKQISEFNGEDTICKQCRASKPPFPPPLSPKLYGAIAAVIVLFVVCLIVFIPKKGIGGEGGKTGPTTPKQPNNKVQVDAYNNYVDNNHFKNAYEYIKDKEDYETYLPKLRASFSEYLLTIDNLYDMTTILIDCDELCTAADIPKETWQESAQGIERDFKQITTYIQKTTLTKEEKNKCKNLISKYADTPFRDKVNDWNKKLEQINEPIAPRPSHDPFVFKYRINDGDLKEKKTEQPNNKNVGVEMKAGDHLDIFTFGKKPTKTKGPDLEPKNIGNHTNESIPYWRILIPSSGTYVFNCGDNIVLTITAKQRFGIQ